MDIGNDLHSQDHENSSQGWNGRNTSVDDSGIDRYNLNPRKHSPKYRSSVDDIMVGDARMNRIAQAEAAIRQDMFKECTFRPEILSLPSSYGAMKGLDTPFHDRVTKWQREKETEIKNKATAIKNSEVAECTFKPKINRNSERAIREIRGNNSSVGTANDRLYKSANLYTEQRYKLIEDEKLKEDSVERSQCTFQPNLITKRNKLYQQVNSKVHREVVSTPQQHQAYNSVAGSTHQTQSVINKDCTFIPKINKIKPNMSSAKLYVSTNVVDRLTRPIPIPAPQSAEDSMLAFDNSFSAGGAGGRPVMDMASFMGSLGGADHSDAFHTPSHANGHRPSTAPRHSEGKDSRRESVDPKEKALKFQQFLERQNQVTKRKEDTIKQITRSVTPNFKPKIHTAQSASTSGTTVKERESSVFERMDRHVQRKQSAEQNKEVTADENCTFAPKINKNAEKLRPRTSFEMSRGDLLRKETNRRMLKLQNEQQELSNMTFQPQISHYAKESGVKSVLQLSTDPSQFLDWYQSKNAEKENERLQSIKRREDQEVEGCTFSPKTIDCPAYVKRIAKSMAVVKAARSSYQDADQSKTQWR